MGLYLGASLISILEIFMFLGNRLSGGRLFQQVHAYLQRALNNLDIHKYYVFDQSHIIHET